MRMTRNEYLLELQKLIAKENGYAELETGVLGTSNLYGILHADEGSTLVPRWPQDWCATGELVEEMQAFARAQDGIAWADWGNFYIGGRSRFGMSGFGQPLTGRGEDLQEAASRCWLAWKCVDLTHLPSVAG
jgi:hypothetical protein